MVRRGALLFFIAVFVWFMHPLQQGVLAKEYEKDLGVSKLRNTAKIVNLSDLTKVDIGKIKKVALLITSTSPLFGGIAEDQLSVKLRDKGFELVEQSKISELTLKEGKGVRKTQRAIRDRKAVRGG